ncbi:MAG: efflux RND transporter periplasmic adaptor subunit [Pseudomonadota bacterium]
MSVIRTILNRIWAGTRLFTIAVSLLVSVLLAACEEPVAVDKNVVRTIKWQTLSEPAAAQQRKISGLVNPIDYSHVGFEVSGQVMTVEVDVGDRVDIGDVLATMDREPYQLAVFAAEAELGEAEARLQNAEQNYGRQERLYNDGWVALAALDTAITGRNAAEQQVEALRARVNLAKRNLAKTKLVAPYSGTISKRTIEPYEEVGAGQVLLEIDGENGLEVTLHAPNSLVSRIDEGQSVDVLFPSIGELTLPGEITQIGTRAATANAFPIKVALKDHHSAVRPGITAEVAFSYENHKRAEGFMVPTSAILSGSDHEHFVFVYDETTSTLSRRSVELVELRDNAVQIDGDAIDAGLIIATAGVPFFQDGLEVKLMGTELR